ncbi:MAG: class I SAM-dependent methyltransferase [Actinomycetota bacterium]|nr:class I SAM-dependent methyltransferase [Actinomycetota bacterium]
MAQEERRDFDKEAANWDEDPRRVKLAADVAQTIIREARPASGMDIMDFGCGTGLVTLQIQPLVKTITAVDSSRGMLEVLARKIEARKISNVVPLYADFEKGGGLEANKRFHLIVSSMTMHHVADTAALLRMWHQHLLPGGILSVADLDAEDGSFHGDNTGVYHFGFGREKLMELMRQAGFAGLKDTTASVMQRDIDGGKREFTVFLITGERTS